MNQQAVKSASISKWLNKALFNTDSASTYFETFIEGIDPMWSLKQTKARVEGIHQETADTITITLKPNKRFESFEAGQHIQLSVEINGVKKTRTFSISSSPAELINQKQIQITIKAVENGEVTQWIHQHLQPGSIVALSDPQGEFTPPKNPSNTLYIAGGSGITPIMSHLRHLIDTKANSKITLLYYAKDQDDFIFKHELQAIAKRLKNFHFYLIETRNQNESTKILSGHICDAHLDRASNIAPDNIYMCGPAALQEAAQECLNNKFNHSVKIHQEYFGLQIKPIEGGTNAAQPVVLAQSNKQIECNQTTPLLDAVEQNGLKPNHGCRMGICYTCKCKKKSGVVRNIVTGQLSGTDEEDIQLCVSVPETPVVIEL